MYLYLTPAGRVVGLAAEKSALHDLSGGEPFTGALQVFSHDGLKLASQLPGVRALSLPLTTESVA